MDTSKRLNGKKFKNKINSNGSTAVVEYSPMGYSDSSSKALTMETMLSKSSLGIYFN